MASRTLIVAFAVAAILLCGSVPAIATVDCCSRQKEAFDGSAQANLGNNANEWVLAQSFRPLTDYELCKVSVLIESAVGGAAYMATVYVQDGPEETANVLTQGVRYAIDEKTWYDFLVSPTPLSQGQEYYIRVEGDVLWFVGQHFEQDPYPRGEAYRDGELMDGDSPPPYYDWCFQTYTHVESPGDACCNNPKERYDLFLTESTTGNNTNTWVLAQSFRPATDYILCKVNVPLVTAVSNPALANLYIQDGPTANAEILAMKEEVKVWEKRWYEFDINDLSLEIGQEYFIRVNGSVIWHMHQDWERDPYPRGEGYRDGESMDGDNPPPYVDWYFMTFAYTAPSDAPPEIQIRPRTAVWAHPNPFAHSTTITYAVPQAGRVNLQIFDVRGRLVRTLLNEPRMEGLYSVTWDGRGENRSKAALGIYHVRLEAAGQVQTGKITVLK